MARRTFALILALMASQAAWADITIRYQLDVKLGPAVPPAMADAMRQQLGSLIGTEMVARVKGSRCMSSFGPMTSILDGDAGRITLVNSTSKRFATVPAANYLDQVLGQEQIPADALAALRNMKLDIQANKTGQTETILGFQAEDTQVTASLGIPIPNGPTIAVRMSLDEWFAPPGQPEWSALQKEERGCPAALGGSASPEAAIERLLQQISADSPQLSDALKVLADPSHGAALRIHFTISVPMLVLMTEIQTGEKGPDPNAPVVELDMRMASPSTETIAEEEFQVPGGYQEAPLSDVMQSVQPGLARAPAPPAQAPGTLADYTGPVERAGSGVSNPIPIDKPEPQYTEEARRAKINGTVLLSLVIDPEGHTRNIKVVRSLDPGLDQKAIEAVRQWTFQPGKKGGEPVAIQAQLEVSFKLLDKPAGQQ